MEEKTGPSERELANRLLGIVNASWMTQAVSVAARLGIADLLEAGPRTSSDLASACGCNPGALHQLLRALCALGICVQRERDLFEITPMGRLLGSNARYSVRSWAIYWGGTAWEVWARLQESVRTGDSVRSKITGAEGFEHLEKDPEAARIFNQGMVEMTRLIAADVARAYDFAGKRVVDVGGGYGELLATILETWPDARGVLFDMPHAISEARARFEARGLSGRCELVTGDFFASVPEGGDVYLLKSVIHDWNDERAKQILLCCRRAMSAQARLLLVERVMPERLEPTPEHQAIARSDLNMLVALAARERTFGEFEALLRAAGFDRVRLLPAGAFSLIEASPS